MEFKICKECNKIFQFSGYGEVLCPSCKTVLEEDMKKVKSCITDNPGISGDEVVMATGVPLEKMIGWLRNEKLIVPHAEGIGVTCDSCGCAIGGGKLCNSCKKDLALGLSLAGNSSMKNNHQEVKKEKVVGMRFIGR